ncbi:putative adipose-regulatory protein-domain-containing protein [Plectosphaerella plurivora]|uniref:Adipose-regulatory protein-domain-containing protein n=1 Tax=Plectosphaerella plurivora TaxID=936078 RepID=A0A9P8UVM6_9PEZI|nr:putative adipose-regulatory protein-domain-containing protein [Plectosphaerella plurivora]
MDKLHGATRLVTSRGIQRTALNLALLVTASLCLLSLAILATGLFFQNYLPDQVIETPLFLQYGAGPHPFASTSLAAANLKSQQAYDMSVSLTAPRSPVNTRKGNFMVTLYLLGTSPTTTDLSWTKESDDPSKPSSDESVVFASRRPAIIPHEDAVVGLASRIIFLPYHLFVHDSQVVRLDVSMAENAILASQPGKLPRWAFVELKAGQGLETYSASLVLTAQLRGLRWLMHHYRLLSFFLATVVFWTAELLFMAVAWLLWTFASNGVGNKTAMAPLPHMPGAGDIPLKREDEYEDEEGALSDVPRSFPTYGVQMPLVYEPDTKRSDRPLDYAGPRLMDAEADDEADDDTKASGASFGRGRGDVRYRSSHAVS